MADNEHPDPDHVLDTFDDELVDVELVDDELADDELVDDETPEEQEAEEKEPERLDLDVDIDERSTCERHITVTIPRDDIERFFDKEFSELVPKAEVPGFRPGHAPRRLIEKRFRRDVGERVKSELLVASLEQINEEHGLSAISEPDIDLEAIEVPDDGPLTFEFDLEVRPQFDVPQWKGLTIEKPVREITQEDVDRALENLLAERGRLVPHEGPAEPGDYITTNLTFKHGEQVLSSAEEEVIRLRPVLSFRDGKIEGFDRLMAGVRAGETRTGEAKLSLDAPNADLRGQTVTAVFEVLEVKKLELPELDEDLLDELGGFELEADLRDAIKDQLQRQLDYEQHQRAREQITAALTVSANWDLPPEMLRRQAQRELDRAVLELRRAERDPAEQRRGHGPGPERALHPRADRRRGRDRGHGVGLHRGDRAVGQAERRVAASGAGKTREIRGDGRAAQPDHRAEGDRTDPRPRPVQGGTFRVRAAGGRGVGPGGRGSRRGDPRGQARGRRPRRRRPAGGAPLARMTRSARHRHVNCFRVLPADTYLCL